MTTAFLGRLGLRGKDNWGDGAFGARRGNTRPHKGIDIAVYPGTVILSVTPGHVTKLGFPYADNPDTEFDESSFRYVQVTLGERHYRYFYMQPIVEVGDWVWSGMPLGTMQDLTKKYPGMTNHLHFSIKSVSTGVRFDPTELVLGNIRV